MKLKVKTLPHFKGDLPKYETEGASAFDIKACLDEDLRLDLQERALIPTGLSFEIPPGFELQCRPRSGRALKEGLSILNSPGTIDSDYRGEIKVIVKNSGNQILRIKDQDRIAQLALCPVYKAKLVLQEELETSSRGGGGFGSTGA